MIRMKDYIEVAYNAVKGVVDKVYLDRPKTVGEEINEYAIVSVPSYVSNREMNPDGDLDYYVTTVNIDLFVKDRISSKATNQKYITRLDDIQKRVLALFPIVDSEKSVMIHRPRVIWSGSDSDSWHYISISARLTTYI